MKPMNLCANWQKTIQSEPIAVRSSRSSTGNAVFASLDVDAIRMALDSGDIEPDWGRDDEDEN